MNVHYTLISALICIVAVSLYSMDQNFDDSNWAGFTTPKNDGSLPDDTYVRGDSPNERVKETFNSYHCSLEQTASDDDAKLIRFIRFGIFAQFCVQASKADTLDFKPFQELLSKIKTGTINTNAEIIHMTEKDLQHRLLSYIPTGQVHALVNNKKVRIQFEHYFQGTDKQATDSGSKLYSNPEAFDRSFPKFREGRSSAGGPAYKWTGEQELTVDYNFEADTAHHEIIMHAFKTLIT